MDWIEIEWKKCGPTMYNQIINNRTLERHLKKYSLSFDGCRHLERMKEKIASIAQFKKQFNIFIRVNMVPD